MGINLSELEAQARLLTPQERARLARTLIEELDAEADHDVEKIWLEEAKLRYRRYTAGELETVEADDVLSRLRERLG